MVGVGAINFVDEAKIRFSVCRKSRRFRERSQDLSAHRFPKHLDAAHDWSSGTARLVEYLSGFKGTALSHIVSGALHRVENLVREFAASGLPEGFGEITGFRGMPPVQEKPKQVGGVTEACHHDLRLKRIHLKK